MKKHVFLSYSSQDVEYAAKVEAELTENDYQVWRDKSNLLPSEQWETMIKLALEDAYAVVVILTPESEQSEWVQNEILYAKQLKLPIFPILLQGEVWFKFMHVQVTDVRGNEHAALADRFYKGLLAVTPVSDLAMEVDTDLLQGNTEERVALIPKIEMIARNEKSPRGKVALEALKNLSNDPDEFVRGMAQIALKRLKVIDRRITGVAPVVAATDTIGVQPAVPPQRSSSLTPGLMVAALVALAIISGVAFLLLGQDDTQEVSEIPSPTPTASLTPTAVASPTVVASPTATDRPSPTPIPLATPTLAASPDIPPSPQPISIDNQVVSPDDVLGLYNPDGIRVPQVVSIPGSFQPLLGCSGEWQPECKITAIAYAPQMGVWTGTFAIPAGSHEYKVALNNSWDENYGLSAAMHGDNIPLVLEEETAVTFYYDHRSGYVTDSVNSIIATLPGSFNQEIGCDTDWQADCMYSWLKDPDGDGIYIYETPRIPAGTWEVKVSVNGEEDADSISFTVPENRRLVVFEYNSLEDALTIQIRGIVELTMSESAAWREGAVSLTTPTPFPDEGLLIWASEWQVELLQSVGNEFGAAHDIKVTVVSVPDTFNEFIAAAEAGTAPDILIGSHDWVGRLAQAGFLMPLDLGDKTTLFTSTSLQAFTYDSQIYGMPYSLENVALVRNTALVPNAPGTWDDVRNISRELIVNRQAEYGFALQPGDPYHFFPIQTAFGGYLFQYNQETGLHDPMDIGLESAGTVAAGEFIQNLVNDEVAVVTTDYEDFINRFVSGEAAMIITGPWLLGDLRESSIPYAISNVPIGPGGRSRPFLGAWGFMVSSDSSDAALAQTFLLDMVATEETMLNLYESMQFSPAFIPALEQIDDADISAFSVAGMYGEPMPSIAQMAEVWTVWGSALNAITQDGQEPALAFAEAARQIRLAIEEGGN